MERNRIIGLVVAGVLGITGGVSLAVNRDKTPQTASPAQTPSATPSQTASDSPSPSPTAGQEPTRVSGQEASTNEPLLWANKRQLHDGDRTVDLNLRGDVHRVVRMDGGWVVAERTNPQEATYALWWVTPKSAPSRFANVVGAWDADPTGRFVVGQTEDNKVLAWTARTGAAKTWDRNPEGPAYSGFMGERVLISMDNSADGLGWQRFLWDPATGQTEDPGGPSAGDVVTPGYPHQMVSPGGAYITGTSNMEGSPALDGNCLHLESTVLKESRVGWNTCDWRLNGPENSFSPDGTRLLAVPNDTDGFGPRTFGVIDASDGPRKLVAEVTMPEWTMFAEFADNNSLYVVRADDIDQSGYAIDRCDFDGECTEVATSRAIPAVGATR